MNALLKSYDYARHTRSSPWEYAVEIDGLMSLGACRNDFRWLIGNGLLEHRKDVTGESCTSRKFRRASNLIFSKQSCFVLTESGARLAKLLSSNGLGRDETVAQAPFGYVRNRETKQHYDGGSLAPEHKPRWDGRSKQLWLGNCIVKRFRLAALNQESILCAFQEEKWPIRIDDPLPPKPDQNAKRRLNDTIKCLNKRQQNPLVHFRGDGTGEGVIWEHVA